MKNQMWILLFFSTMCSLANQIFRPGILRKLIFRYSKYFLFIHRNVETSSEIGTYFFKNVSQRSSYLKKKGILGPVLKIRLVQKENSRRKSPEKNVQGLPDFCHTLYIIDVKREAPSFISTCFVSFSFASLSSSSYLQVLLRLLIILSVSK